MKITLMWAINDFSTYGFPLGWKAAQKLACLYCMDLSKEFTLKNNKTFLV